MDSRRLEGSEKRAVLGPITGLAGVADQLCFSYLRAIPPATTVGYPPRGYLTVSGSAQTEARSWRPEPLRPAYRSTAHRAPYALLPPGLFLERRVETEPDLLRGLTR